MARGSFRRIEYDEYGRPNNPWALQALGTTAGRVGEGAYRDWASNWWENNMPGVARQDYLFGDAAKSVGTGIAGLGAGAGAGAGMAGGLGAGMAGGLGAGAAPLGASLAAGNIGLGLGATTAAIPSISMAGSSLLGGGAGAGLGTAAAGMAAAAPWLSPAIGLGAALISGLMGTMFSEPEKKTSYRDIPVDRQAPRFAPPRPSVLSGAGSAMAQSELEKYGSQLPLGFRV
jgi:hypothetical protein